MPDSITEKHIQDLLAQIKSKRMDEQPITEPESKAQTAMHNLMDDIELEFAELESLLKDIS